MLIKSSTLLRDRPVVNDFFVHERYDIDSEIWSNINRVLNKNNNVC